MNDPLYIDAELQNDSLEEMMMPTLLEQFLGDKSLPGYEQAKISSLIVEPTELTFDTCMQNVMIKCLNARQTTTAEMIVNWQLNKPRTMTIYNHMVSLMHYALDSRIEFPCLATFF